MPNISIFKTLKRRGTTITINSSSDRSSPVVNILDFYSSSIWTSQSNDTDPHFIINLGKDLVLIERYAIKIVANDFYPLEWEIIGSFDGQNWSIIDHREYDICENNTYVRTQYNMIGCKSQMHKMFAVSEMFPIRYIKFRQVGLNCAKKYNNGNGNGWENALYLSGFAVFGDIYQSIHRCSIYIKAGNNINRLLMQILFITTS